ncbi:MAG: UMP kinase [bacterium]
MKRILLKLSGEALMGAGDFGIDPGVLHRVAAEIAELTAAGAEIGLVIGGGNIFRGVGLAGSGMNRVTGDHIGMLATVMNSLAMQDALAQAGVEAHVLSALGIDKACEPFSQRQALAYLDQGKVVILAAGTGNPFFTTDTAAGLRAIEINAEVMIKATKVNGIYTDDPVTNPDAEFIPSLDYNEAIREEYGVMDVTAMVLCRDHGMPLRVMNINEPGALQRLMAGEDVGTLVTGGESS